MKTRSRITTLIIMFTMITTVSLYAQSSTDTNTMHGYEAGNLQTGGQYNNAYGYRAGDKVTGDHNTFLGTYAGGLSAASGNHNTFVGSYAGSTSTTSASNVFVGFGAGRSITSGSYNVFLGREAGWKNANGANNIFIGNTAGYNTTSGTSNTIIGDGAGTENATGQNNVYLGRAAGALASGSGNVFIGHFAGYNERTGSNKLYIDNSNTSIPLIHGDFSSNQLGINAVSSGTHTLTVGGTLNATALYANNQLIEMLWAKNSGNIYFSTGNVGIGVSTPSDRLHISGGNIVFDNGNTPTLYTGTGTTELNRFLQLVNSSGLQSSSGLKAGGILVADSYGYANPSKNDLIVKGKIGIGTPLTANTNGYQLAVNGKIGAHDLQIERSSDAWPDYVFDQEYKLPSLYEVEKYVRKNKHLAEVPSADQIGREGYSVDQMTETLLKKVEELTLYIIQQQKEIDALKKKLETK